MEIFEKIFRMSHLASENHPDRSHEFVFKKVVEEVGELGDCLTMEEPPEPIEGETADILICGMDLMYLLAGSGVTGSVGVQNDSFQYWLRGYSGVFANNDSFVRGVVSRYDRLAVYDQGQVFPMIVSYQGRLARLLNQPDRSDEHYANLILLVLEYSVLLCWDKKKQLGHSPASFYNLLDSTVDAKLSKWKSFI